MKKHIKRKRSYSVFFIIIVAMAIIWLGIFPDQTLLFHVIIFIAALSLFVIAWETLLLMHNYFEGKYPIERNPTSRILIQIFLTTILFTIFSKALFLSASYLFKIEISSMLEKVLYLLNFQLAVIFYLKLFGTQYFTQLKEDVITKTNLEKEQDLDKGIVPLISQILIEKVVKHIIISIRPPLEILTTSDGDFFIVKNSMVKKPQEESSNKFRKVKIKIIHNYS